MAELSPLESPDTSGIETSRANLIAQQQRLMSLLDERAKPNPLDFWSTLAGAAANSGNWGSQTLAAVGAGAGLADRQQEAKEITSAQMRMEIANSQDQMARQKLLSNELRKTLAQPGTYQESGMGATGGSRYLALMAITDPSKALEKLAGVDAKNMELPPALLIFRDALAKIPANERPEAIRQWATTQLRGDPNLKYKALTDLNDAYSSRKINKEDYELLRGRILSDLGVVAQAPAQQVQPAPTVPALPSTASSAATTTETNTMLNEKEKAALEVKKEEARIIEEATNRQLTGKPLVAKFEAISAYDPDTVAMTESRLAELTDLVGKNKDVVGLLVHKGPIAAMLTLMQNGVNTPWGSIRVPVEEAIKNLKLSPDKQAIGRQIAQLIATLNQDVMRQGKAIFGPSISVFDAQQMAKPGFSESDPAKFISYLAYKTRVVNLYNGKLNDAMQDYYRENPDKPPSAFFNDPKSPYSKISKNFNSVYKDLTDNSPFR
jgi:hypothetical protein